MDNPQPEEEDVLFANDPLDVVELVLAAARRGGHPLQCILESA